MTCSNDCTTGKFGEQSTSCFHILIQLGLWIGIKEGQNTQKKNKEKRENSFIGVLDALHGRL
jgi:hypothetical protein